MADLTMTLFGPFKATVNGELLPQFRSVKAQALLILLVVESGVAHRREALMELLWPGAPLQSSQLNLRQTLFRLRKMIPELTAEDGGHKVPFILSDRLTVRVNPDAAIELDSGCFDDLISRNRRHDHQDLVSCPECRERSRLAANLYSGPFLADFYLTDSNDFEDWAAAKREVYRRAALAALNTLTAVELQSGAFNEAQAYARQQIAIDPLDEQAYRRLLEALARNGRRNEALTEYDKLRELLAVELGVEPSEETQQLHLLLVSGEQLPATPVKAVEQVAVLGSARSGDIPIGLPTFLTEEGGEKHEKRVFVGRERELAQLHEFLDQSLAGRGGVAFVTGEAGRGKTSLLDEFAGRTQAAHPDLVVAAGVCDAYSGVGDAYLPFRDVMTMLTGDVETHWSAGVIARDHALRLWHLLPATANAIVEQAPDLLDTFISAEALARRVVTFSSVERGKLALLQERLAQLIHTGRQSQDQGQLFGAYTEVLKTLARKHPLLLIIDDLHWADISSINLLFYLARRVGESRILIVGAYRPEDVNLGRDDREHPLKDVLGEFKRYFGDIWIDLDQGEQAESREFVDALLDSEPNRLGEVFRQELARHTRGHSLFTVETLRDMQERGDLVQDEAGYWNESPNLGWDTFPPRVEGVIERRIGRLEPDLRELLSIASVEGEEFTAEVLARVLGTDQRQLLYQLSQDLEKRHRLVQERGTIAAGRWHLSRFRFGHALFQRYLYEALGDGERRLLHGEIAQALEALYEGQTDEKAGQLAQHFLEAGEREKAIEYAHQAAHRDRAIYAYDEAIQHLQNALDLLETAEQAEKRLELLEELADVHSELKKDTKALSYYQATLEVWSSLEGADKMIAVRLRRKILETALNLLWSIEIEALEPWSQTLTASQAYLETRLPLAQSEPQLEWVRVLTILANIYEIGFPSPMDLDSAQGYAQAAVDRAEQLDAPEELSAALAVLGNIYYDRGRFRDQLAVSRRRLALSRDPRFGSQSEQMAILWGHSSALMVLGEYALAMDHILEIERLAIQIRSIVEQVETLARQALCFLRLDRWDEILRLDEMRRELERRYSPNELGGAYCMLLAICAAAHALQGDLDQARVLRQHSYVRMTRDSGGSPENWGRTQYY